MIKTLSIKRFKSIRELSIACRKVNVFIGAPDTGKTNILDALTLLSRLGWYLPLDSSLRLRAELGFDALFYRQFYDAPLEIALEADGKLAEDWERHLKTTSISVQAVNDSAARALRLRLGLPGAHRDMVGIPFGSGGHWPFFERIRQYAYLSSENWQYQGDRPRPVTPPNGSNLLYVARHDESAYEFLLETVAPVGWKLRFDAAMKTFRLSEVREKEIIDYNLDLLSDSLKRLIFYGTIVLSSQEAVLVLDEPDVFAFPPYPKTLGQMIAADATNQFFVTTHNPYFLSAVIEKTPTDQLALFVCHRKEDGATGARLLTLNEVSRVIEHGASVFFNLDEFEASA